MLPIADRLRKLLHGDVRDDQMSRTIYSTDASIYEIEPTLVVLPRSVEDILITIEIAKESQLPIIPRGAGTGLTGGCIGKGIIIDTSRYLNRVIAVDTDNHQAICEPGVVQDTLNALVAPAGLRLGANTSTGNRATIGGMIGNNSAGSHSLRYGQMADCVEELELITSAGELITLKTIDNEEWHTLRQQPGTIGRIHRELYRIRESYGQVIQKEFPFLPRQSSGYALNRLIGPMPYNASSIAVGAEGTLGFVTRATLKLAPTPHCTGLLVIHLNSLKEAVSAVPEILKHNPSALEIVDDKIITIGRSAPSLQNGEPCKGSETHLSWLQGNPKALLIIEFDAETREALDALLQRANRQLNHLGYSQITLTSKKMMDAVWKLRKSGLGLLLSRRSYTRAISFIEDLVVPVDRLPGALDELLSYLESHGKEAGVYGHIGVGALHIRPWINSRDPQDFALMQRMMVDVAEMVKRHKGSLTAEHGDGLVRSWLNKKMFGPTLYEAFKEVKQAFDPDGLMNPGKIVDGPDFTENLRADPSTPQPKIDTFLDWKKEGGFSLAVDLCNGNGQCRKRDGIMCPSFQASGDEWHNTRARAQALRAVVNGRRPLEAFTEKEMHAVLDLCIQCKGCKTECPSQVDMAKMKAEFLYHYHKKHGIPLRDRLFGHLDTLMTPLSFFPSWSNRLMAASQPLLKQLGIAPQRTLPQLAAQPFYSWWSKKRKRERSPDTSPKTQTCVLFIDTFTAFYDPHIGIAAIKVLDALGYNVIIPPRRCCGRPLISKGLLPSAKKKAQKLAQTLESASYAGLPLIGLEPSCTLTIRDDYPSLDPATAPLAKRILTFQEFLHQNRNGLQEALSLAESTSKSTSKKASHYAIHGHCYEKALMGMDKTAELFSFLPQTAHSIVPSGCCGMAGSFGYETEHYVFSLRMAETTLFRHLRNLGSTQIVANGTSCRQQIHHALGIQPLHIAEVLANYL